MAKECLELKKILEREQIIWTLWRRVQREQPVLKFSKNSQKAGMAGRNEEEGQ